VSKNTYGYPIIWTGEKSALAHRVVWEHYNGKIPDGLEINHIDGNKANYAIINLEAISHRENIVHSYKNLGRVQKKKLTNTDIVAILDFSKCGVSQRDIAKMFGVSQMTVCRYLRITNTCGVVE
jgi:hypothetical protein